MASTHYRIATGAAVGLSVVGVLAVLIAVIQLIVLLINGPDPLTRAAGLNPFWATLMSFGSSVAVGLLLVVAGGVGRAIIALAAPKSAA
jgi:hypothetical protein